MEEISDEEWEYTFATNISAMFYLVKAALPHMGPGSSIIGSYSVNSDMPSPALALYAATKAAIANFAASLAGMLGERGIRVNSVAPGPIWTPLIPATMPEEKVKNFGKDTPLGRAGQPRRTGCGICPSGHRRGQLHFRRPDRRDRRPTDPVELARSPKQPTGAAAPPVLIRGQQVRARGLDADHRDRAPRGLPRVLVGHEAGNITLCGPS